MNGLSYPGCLLDADLSIRVLKCYLYKFVKNKITKKTRYDKIAGRMTEKKYFWFNFSRPLFSAYHSIDNMVRFNDLIGSEFIGGKSNVFFVPHYRPEDYDKKRKAFVYRCTGLELERYLRDLNACHMQNIIIFDSSFLWAIDVFEDIVMGSVDCKDVVVYFKRPRQA